MFDRLISQPGTPACLTLACALLLWAGSAGAVSAAAELSPDDLGALSLEDLMSIEVTSVSRRAESLGQAASSIFVITGEDIRRSGATSLPEALRLAPNLQVAQKSANEWAISARGFNTELANKLLVMIDGRTIYTPLYAGVQWQRQDYLLEDIERIEVISGPGGTLWGANAVNGVINIITKSARDTKGGYAEAGGGSELQGFTGMRYGAALAPNVAVRAYGKYFERDNQNLAGGGEANDHWGMGQGGFRLDAEATAADSLTLQGDYYDGVQNLDGLSGYNVLGRWVHAFSEESQANLQIYYDRTYLAALLPPLVLPPLVVAPAGVLKDELDTFDVDFQHDFPLGERQRIVWGLGYRYKHNVVTNAPALAFEPEVLNRDVFSAFVQDEIALLDTLSLTVGTKLEHNDYTGVEVQPSVRLAWSFTERQMLWAAVSRAVRTPSRFDRHLRLPTPLLAPFIENLLVGSRDFDSEVVVAYEAGYRAQLGSRVTLAITGYYNDYDELRSTEFTPITLFPLVFSNDLIGETHGFEFNGTWQALPWWQLRGGYTLLEEDIRVKRGHFDFNNALNETADPEQQFSIRSAMSLPRDFELDAGLRWVDRLPTNDAGVLVFAPDYVELDVRVAWRPMKRLELSLVGQNLLHEDHAEYIPSGGNARIEIERAVLGKASITF